MLPSPPGAPRAAARRPGRGRRLRRTTLVALATAAVVGAGVLPAQAVSTGAANARIARLVPARLHDPVLGHHVAVRVFDTATWRSLYMKSSYRPFRVASNTKIVTAATALQALGPAKRFPTRVVLGRHGHVYIVGGGDPLLSSSKLRTLAATTAKAAKSRGLKKVVVHLDDTLFSRWTGLPSGFDHRCGSPEAFRGYCMVPVHALTYNRHYGADNGKDAARYFTSALNAAPGLAATYVGRRKAPALTTNDRTAAPPVLAAASGGHRLDVIIRAMFFPSDDEIAETLFRQVAIATGHTPNMAGSRTAQRQVLRQLGVPLQHVVTSSGSGRSMYDRFTAAAMVKLLRVAIDKHHPRMAVLRDGTAATGHHPLLMRAGIDGTLTPRYGRYSTRPSSCARGKVYAKTGTLADAITLSGYAKGADGHWKVFAIFVNSRPTAYRSLTTRQHVDRIAATITGCY